MVLIVTPQRRFVSLLEHQAQQQQQQVKKAAAILTNSHPNPNVVMNLPNPVLKAGKQAPPNTYTSKMFDTTRSATINSRWVVTTNEPPQQQQCTAEEGSSEQGQGQVCQTPTTTTASTRTTESDDNEDENDEEELHLPAGQHLLMDIQNVDASFLASEERLANAMLEVVENCGLTLLSYHCHGLEPSGVSCVGVLLESHVSFHTWPMEGVITLDLFTCGPGSLLPIVSTVERLFSVPITIPISILAADGAGSSPPPPETVWAYKLRGFGGDDNQETTAELTDLFTFPIGTMTDYKKEVSSSVNRCAV
jgi:S-adenosylmethionine decarboxylase proenzyme